MSSTRRMLTFGSVCTGGPPGAATASGSGSPRAVEPDTQERPELLALHRLGDVVGRPGVEALPAIVLHGLGRQGDDRQRRGTAAARGSPASSRSRPSPAS